MAEPEKKKDEKKPNPEKFLIRPDEVARLRAAAKASGMDDDEFETLLEHTRKRLRESGKLELPPKLKAAVDKHKATPNLEVKARRRFLNRKGKQPEYVYGKKNPYFEGSAVDLLRQKLETAAEETVELTYYPVIAHVREVGGRVVPVMGYKRELGSIGSGLGSRDLLAKAKVEDAMARTDEIAHEAAGANRPEVIEKMRREAEESRNRFAEQVAFPQGRPAPVEVLREKVSGSEIGSSDSFKHQVGFNKLTPKQQEEHIRDHGAEPVKNKRASGYSRYQQHVTLHEPDDEADLLPTAKGPTTIKASLMFGEIEHEGDLEREWEGNHPIHDVDKNGQMREVGRTAPLSQIAAKHGIKLHGFQALEDVDEDTNVGSESGRSPSDGFYEGGGRYEEGVIEVSGEAKSLKAFLQEARAKDAYFSVARVEYVGKPPATRMTTKPTPGFDKWKAMGSSGADESHDVMAHGQKIATVTHYIRTSSFPGSSYGPTPAQWRVSGMSGMWQSGYPTKEAALKDVKKNYQPRPRL